MTVTIDELKTILDKPNNGSLQLSFRYGGTPLELVKVEEGTRIEGETSPDPSVVLTFNRKSSTLV